MENMHHPEPRPSKITVVVTYNGVDRSFSVEKHAAVSSLLQRSIHEFHVATQPHLLSLFRNDGTKVDENQSIEAAGISEGTVLYLRQDVVKGG